MVSQNRPKQWVPATESVGTKGIFVHTYESLITESIKVRVKSKSFSSSRPGSRSSLNPQLFEQIKKVVISQRFSFPLLPALLYRIVQAHAFKDAFLQWQTTQTIFDFFLLYFRFMESSHLRDFGHHTPLCSPRFPWISFLFCCFVG